MNDNLRESKRIGSPIVALHSFVSAKSQWEKLKTDLEDRAQVLTLDLPGSVPTMGRKKNPEVCSELAIEHIQENNTDNSSKLHLVGHSNSGSAALKLALQAPDMVKSITVYEPTVFHIAGIENRIGNKLQQEFAFMKDRILQSDSSGVSDAGIEQFWKFWDDTDFWDQLSSEDQREFSGKIENVVSEIESCFSDNWLLEDLKELNIPVQVIMGMQSPLVVQNLAVQIVSALPAGRLTTLPLYGHFAPITQPEVINPLIIEHIYKVEQRSDSNDLYIDHPNTEQKSSTQEKPSILNRIRNSSFSFFS